MEVTYGEILDLWNSRINNAESRCLQHLQTLRIRIEQYESDVPLEELLNFYAEFRDYINSDIVALGMVKANREIWKQGEGHLYFDVPYTITLNKLTNE